jgi:hypothetical protein
MQQNYNACNVGTPGDRLDFGANAAGGCELDIRVDRLGVVLMPVGNPGESGHVRFGKVVPGDVEKYRRHDRLEGSKTRLTCLLVVDNDKDKGGGEGENEKTAWFVSACSKLVPLLVNERVAYGTLVLNLAVIMLEHIDIKMMITHTPAMKKGLDGCTSNVNNKTRDILRLQEWLPEHDGAVGGGCWTSDIEA